VGPIIDKVWPSELVERAGILTKWARQVPNREAVRIAIKGISGTSEEIELFTRVIRINFSVFFM
jgi:hypothetical protein